MYSPRRIFASHLVLKQTAPSETSVSSLQVQQLQFQSLVLLTVHCTLKANFLVSKSQVLCHMLPRVYFACEGQTQMFVQGCNPAEHVWQDSSDAPAPAFHQVGPCRPCQAGAHASIRRLVCPFVHPSSIHSSTVRASFHPHHIIPSPGRYRDSATCVQTASLGKVCALQHDLSTGRCV